MAESLDDFLKGLGTLKDDLRTMADTPVGKVVHDFESYIVFESQANLKEAGRYASGELSQSIEPVSDITEEGKYTVRFYADYYWAFNDQGVNGVYNNFGAPFSFKTLNPSSSMVDSFMGVGKQNWLASKGIKSLNYIDKQGNQIVKNLVTDSDYRGAAYVLARGTKSKGIQPTYYLTSLFSDERIDKLVDDIGDALTKMI